MSAIFELLVKIIIHLPDLDARSCSAQRFAGAIMLSASDDTLLAVEESLIHECGHQILYCAMELEPLIRRDAEGTFVLPWSGAERDTYGYFHATYIYLILARYFEDAMGRNLSEDRAVFARFSAITQGLQQALIDLESIDAFTPAGRQFLNGMKTVASEIFRRHPR